jgi:hypothetical protein
MLGDRVVESRGSLLLVRVGVRGSEEGVGDCCVFKRNLSALWMCSQMLESGCHWRTQRS